MTGNADAVNTESTNPDELQEIFDKLELGEDVDLSTISADNQGAGTPEATPKDDKEASESAQETQGQGKEGEGQPAASEGDTDRDPDGIATKDNKHIIPYSVLKNERDRAGRAEQIAKEMTERVQFLEKLVQGGSQEANSGESASTTATDDLSDDDLEALREDFPTVYKAVKASMARATALEQQLQAVQEPVQNAQREQANSAAQTVQEAIDSVPRIAYLQSADADRFELAKQFDAALRSQPAWKDKTLAERFAKVADMVEAASGPIEIPGAKNKPNSNGTDMRAAAAAKIAAAAKEGATVPTSLSEFPAGHTPADNETSALESMTHSQLAEKFASMSPDQMDAYLANL